ncbi:MAG: hypothetical protein EAZ99_16560 [Alphaproteobacteria bacterium]|nr:hypothetical protein [Alphaproteobacteria bacterium]TAD87674.1 MAG: hypothetical protein EAZ99_16560 [Alphaproteobacteria bacterium]
MLTTVATLAQELDRDPAVEELLLARLIREASATIERACQRRFGYQRATDRLVGDGGRILVLPRTPVHEIHAIHCDGVPVLDWSVLDSRVGLLDRAAGWGWRAAMSWWGDGPTSPAQFEIDATAGFRLPGCLERDLPEDLERACLELAKAWWWARGRDPLATSESAGSLSHGLAAGLPMVVVELLRPWRRGI